MVCEGVHQIAFNGLQKALEILHWEALLCLKSLFEWPMASSASLESVTDVTGGKTLRHLIELLDRLERIGRGYNEDMESESLWCQKMACTPQVEGEIKGRWSTAVRPNAFGIPVHLR